MATDRDRFGRFGGAEALAKAVDSSVDRLAALLRHPAALRALLVGNG